MTDTRALELFKRHEQLVAARSVLDSHLREVAERVLPRQDTFQRVPMNEGEKRTEKVFDSTALLALDRAASAIDSLITPATQTYQGLAPEDDRLEGDREIRLYLDEVNKSIFRMRYRPLANFASQAHECYVSLMAFGTLGMFIDDHMGIGTRYKSIALSEMYIAENHAGIVDYVHRKFPMSARQAAQKFGEKALPDKIRKSLQNDPFCKYDFLHCVKPNEEIKSRARDYQGMPWTSYYASFENSMIVSEGGFRTMPYATSRHVTAPRETYGRSPAMMVLPDIKMINEMEKTIIRAAHKVVDPPLLAYGDGILNAFSTRPNAINYGGVDERGTQLVQPMKMGSNLPIVFEMQRQKREMINDAFYITLFQILVQNPQMTATEALIRAQEKGQLLAPTIGRQQNEFLGPMTERELDIMSAAGVLPPMPEKLRMAGGRVKIIYSSPLTRLRRAEDGVAIVRTLEQLAPLGAVKPHLYDNFDEDAIARELSDIYGVPAKVMRAVEMVAEIRARNAEAQEQQQALADADITARTRAQNAKAIDLAQPAQATA